MFIERIQIDEGFLDGLDVTLVPGLNVLIGARGTGKTSLIELIRFCLDVRGYTQGSHKRSREHALSVLAAGQITVTLSSGHEKIVVTRTASDTNPRATAPFKKPIIFSQTEIETVGLQPGGRLQLLDSFARDGRQSEAAEAEATSIVRSLTTEVEALRRELDDFARQVIGLSEIDGQLAELAPAERELAKTSTDAGEKKKLLDEISRQIASIAVAASSIERFRKSVARWQTTVSTTISSVPAMEAWPAEAGQDPLVARRERVQLAYTYIQTALDELNHSEADLADLARTVDAEKIAVEEQARQLRREIEALQTGAGDVVRRVQQLREQKAQLESLRELSAERQRSLDNLIKRRGKALDQLDSIREERFRARSAAAERLNRTLGPSIRIAVGRSGQFDAFVAAIADALRGSGLRYGDLAPVIALHISPRELLEATDTTDFSFIADATGISKDRAARTLAQLKDAALGTLSTVPVEDSVAFQLLDGSEYKDISELSTGQRCTVVLPLVLRHTERMLIVDQPEDHIDNAFVADTLIRAVLARDPSSQIIFSTHNANIPVLGNADWVIQLGSDGRRGFPLANGALNDGEIVRAITTVMEGGVEAFERRASFYRYHLKQ